MNSTCLIISRVILCRWANSKLVTTFYAKINIATLVRFVLNQPRPADYAKTKAELDIIMGRSPDQSKPNMSKNTKKIEDT